MVQDSRLKKKNSEQIYYKLSWPEPNFRKLLVCKSADNKLPRRYFPSNLVLLETSLYLEYLQAAVFGYKLYS